MKISQEREEFLKRFYEERNIKNPKYNRDKDENNFLLRSDYLYLQGKQMRARQLYVQQKKKKEEEEESECTFKPNLISNRDFRDSVICNKMIDRQRFWERKKKEKIMRMSKDLSNKEFEECNFHPFIVRNVNFYIYRDMVQKYIGIYSKENQLLKWLILNLMIFI